MLLPARLLAGLGEVTLLNSSRVTPTRCRWRLSPAFPYEVGPPDTRRPSGSWAP